MTHSPRPSRSAWRRLPLLVLACPAASAGAAYARPAVSPILHDLGTDSAIQNLAVSDVPGMGRVIDLIVSGGVDDAALQSVDAVIGTSLPDGTRTIRMPVARFEELRALPGLTRITAGYRCELLNDTSVPTTNATPGWWTHSGAGVFAGTAGLGVIVGMVDSGVDWSHDDFKNPDGTTRLITIWDQKVTTTPPAGYLYGTEWSAAQINANLCTHHDTNGHGTHVLGSAAGDGSATGNAQPAYRFMGMAPKADLIVVASDLSTPHVIDGVNYIFQKAAALGRPAVVNLSIGSQFGAHDGTETFDTALSALTGAGKIVAAAAGNEGNAARHARLLVPPGPAQTVTFDVPTYTQNSGAANDLIFIDAYYNGSANMSVTLTSPGPSPVVVGPVALGGSGSNAGSAAGNIYVENGFTPSPSGDKNVYIQIYDSAATREPRSGSWTITLTPVSTTAGTQFDAWQSSFTLGAPSVAVTFTSHVDEHILVASPGSAAQLITAAAYITKVGWPSIDGNNYAYPGLTTLGALATYSSPGPLRNGAQKPDITAPGSAIVSAKSIFTSPAPANALINPDGQHVTETGTSMACPHVTGACALLLAVTPTLTPAQIKTTLQAQAVVDGQTGAVPNSAWGYGKLRLNNGPDTNAPTITLLTPNGGEAWMVGETRAVTWTAGDNVGVTGVDIEWSDNLGGSWMTVATGEANDGSYDWHLPNDPTTNALVRVTAHDAATNSGADVSDAKFTIAAASAVEELPGLPARPVVLQNRPNPFNPTTRIGFGQPAAGHVRLTLFTADGRFVRTLADGLYPPATPRSAGMGGMKRARRWPAGSTSIVSSRAPWWRRDGS